MFPLHQISVWWRWWWPVCGGMWVRKKPEESPQRKCVSDNPNRNTFFFPLSLNIKSSKINSFIVLLHLRIPVLLPGTRTPPDPQIYARVFFLVFIQINLRVRLKMSWQHLQEWCALPGPDSSLYLLHHFIQRICVFVFVLCVFVGCMSVPVHLSGHGHLGVLWVTIRVCETCTRDEMIKHYWHSVFSEWLI